MERREGPSTRVAQRPLDDVTAEALGRAWLYDDQAAYRAGVEAVVRALASGQRAPQPLRRTG